MKRNTVVITINLVKRLDNVLMKWRESGMMEKITQVKHLHDLILSATIALTIVFLLFNIVTKYKTYMVNNDIIHNVDTL
jgi:hypothetical protein